MRKLRKARERLRNGPAQKPAQQANTPPAEHWIGYRKSSWLRGEDLFKALQSVERYDRLTKVFAGARIGQERTERYLRKAV